MEPIEQIRSLVNEHSLADLKAPLATSMKVELTKDPSGRSPQGTLSLKGEPWSSVFGSAVSADMQWLYLCSSDHGNDIRLQLIGPAIETASLTWALSFIFDKVLARLGRYSDAITQK